jgi:hypothetical protein
MIPIVLIVGFLATLEFVKLHLHVSEILFQLADHRGSLLLCWRLHDHGCDVLL